MVFLELKNSKNQYLIQPRIPKFDLIRSHQHGTKQILDEQGADGLVKWIKEQKEVLLTDTTFRDAHQSLLATRVRTNDIYTNC